MKRRQFGLGLFATGLGAASALLANDSEARPGGGQTFRSNSSNSGSGSSNTSSWSNSSSNSSPSGSSLFDKKDDDDWMKPRSPSEPTSPTPSPAPESNSVLSSSSSPSTPQSGPRQSGGVPFITGKWVFFGFGAFFIGTVLRHAFKENKEYDTSWSSSIGPGMTPTMKGMSLPVVDMGAPGTNNSTFTTTIPDRTYHRGSVIQKVLDSTKSKDPHFSMIVFEDFLYALYVEAQVARGKKTLAALEPYLGVMTDTYDSDPQVCEVRDIVVGAMRIESVKQTWGQSPRIEVEVIFDANYTEVYQDGRVQSYMVIERWTLERDPHVASRLPEKSTQLGCPNCGAQLDKNIAAKCGYCGEVASPGKFDWTVNYASVREREAREPMLTGTTEEVGTDLPTIAAPDVQQAFGKLVQKDPAMTWTAFQARVTAIFQAFYQGWNERDLTCVRPYLSDNLMTTQRYWIETYKAQGLRNVCEKPRIAAIHLARVRSDNVLDSITVRVYAACIDSTVDTNGHVVGGNQQKERQYSEYWTLIRSAKRQGIPREDPVCPNCGAPNAEINMSGSCGHCNTHITSGEFDWVLSRIEQDEAYHG